VGTQQSPSGKRTRCIIVGKESEVEEKKSLNLQGLRTIRWEKIRAYLSKGLLFLLSISVFILALVLVKEGAKPLAPVIRDMFSVDSAASALGFGWLTASMVLSGSPVAATALAFLDAGVLSPHESFAMIAGSRLGASFIVLLIGFVYIMRGQHRQTSLGAGLLSLLVTQSMYIPVIFLGFYILSRGWLHQWQIEAEQALNSPLDMFFDPIIASLSRYFATWVLFPIGFVLLFFGLWLFDRLLPDLHLEESRLGQVHRLLYRPVVIFALGAGITALTMSVSVSLGLLVPLSARGYIRRENIIPYIMGANITTFVDTLIAAALLANPAALTVVLVQMVSVGLVSSVILILGFRFYERLLNRLVSVIGKDLTSLLAYILLTLGIPIGLILIG
jgi:Na+/phosphate symporter